MTSQLRCRPALYRRLSGGGANSFCHIVPVAQGRTGEPRP